ncbi:divalent-cation tolerance protein CutA [Elusimicrobiota bacterium]
MSDRIVVFVTAGSSEEADKIASVLVERKLAACVSINKDIVSIYRWKGDICRDKEVQLIIKSKKTMLASIITAVKELHSYEIPEIASIDISGGSLEYLRWIDESVSEK